MGTYVRSADFGYTHTHMYRINYKYTLWGTLSSEGTKYKGGGHTVPPVNIFLPSIPLRDQFPKVTR